MAEQDVTIYDIAREAGVSPATVSRVLTNNAKVSAGKREQVEEVIRRRQFRPNAVARGLSTSTRILGLMTADIRNPYYASLAVECEKAAHERGYTVLLCNIFNDKELEDAHLEKLCAQRVEAIIQIGCRVDDLVSDPAYVEHVNQVTRGIPFVVSGKLEGADCFIVKIDHGESMKLVMDHLVSLGHRDIAFFGGTQRVESTTEKLQQYSYFLGAHGLSLKGEYIREGNYARSGGYDCMKRLLRCPRIPTAVIAVNDYSAIGAMEAVYEQGLSIPGDISIISFDNTFLCDSVQPKLTSVDYNYPEFGKLLVETAFMAVGKREVPKIQYIKPRLVIRNSCAAVYQNRKKSLTNQKNAPYNK
jgi:DNA-binding LacI/PurR family transcriptional regulator